MERIAAQKADTGMRLDAFLAKRLNQSRAYVKKVIDEGRVNKGGSLCKPAQLVGGDDIFMVTEPSKSASCMAAEPIALDIIFADEHIAVINKPAGMVVHPGAGIKNGTLCNALLHHFPDMCINNVERPGIIHRLDKNTSGVMVVAKTNEAHQALSDAFKNRRVQKIYRCFCVGELDESRFELKTGHMRHPQNRLRFFTGLSAPKMPSSHVRLAHTSFEVLSRGFGVTELRATLHTGRTHQIRAHLADINHPLVKDDLYGAKKVWPKSHPQEVL
ncbi:MAG TPA: RluA family pseudouridine synthase, partial [Myxococcota bacterium]|nr:RluA family pseudouridine synthase [Myxococcota bacterium]